MNSSLPSLARWRVFLVAVVLTSVLCTAHESHARSGDNDLNFGAGNGVVQVSPLAPFTPQDWDTPHAAARYADGRIIQAGQCKDSLSSVVGTSLCVRRFSQNGTLDLAFGTNGVLQPFSAYQFAYSGAFSMSVEADSTALIAGTCRGPALPLQNDFPFALRGEQVACLVRIDSSGNLDPTFGTGGRLFFAVHFLAGITFGYSSADGLASLVDGRFYVVGGCSASTSNLQPRFCVSRHNANGSLDTSYASTGWLMLPFAGVTGSEIVRGVGTALDGSLIVAGTCSDPTTQKTQACALRTTSAGVLVAGFGNAGKTTFDDFQLDALSLGVGNTIPSSNLIALIGRCVGGSYPSGVYPCSKRLNALTGQLDSTYGSSGLVDIGQFPTVWPYPVGATTWHDGSTFFIAICSPKVSQNFTTRFCVGKVTPNGVIDTSFGVGGIADVPGTDGGGYPLPNVVLSDFFAQTLTLSGRCYVPNGLGFCLARVIVSGNFFDIDGDSSTTPTNDVILYVRHLLGYRNTALVSNALGAYADRTSATDIATYLSTPNPSYPNCSASIVGAPGGPQAMLDGIVLLRAMMGLTGDAVTNGIAFPAGTARTSWVDIRAHLNGNCGMVLN